MPAPILALPALPALGGLAAKTLTIGGIAGGATLGGVAVAGRNDDWAKNLGLDAESRIQNEAFDRSTGQLKDYSFMDAAGSFLLGQDLRQLNAAAQKKSDHDLVNNVYGKQVSGLRQAMAAMGISDPDVLTPGKRQTANDFGAELTTKTAILNRFRELKAAGVPNEKLGELTKGGFSTLTLDALDSAANAWERDPNNITSATNTTQRNIDTANEQRDRQLRIDARTANQQEIANTFARSDREYRQWKDAKDDEWRRWSYQQQLADKRESRADRKQALIMQMQQSDLDRSYMRERDERADARADRKQRTAMLMQMVQGLSKLGYGMAI